MRRWIESLRPACGIVAMWAFCMLFPGHAHAQEILFAADGTWSFTTSAQTFSFNPRAKYTLPGDNDMFRSVKCCLDGCHFASPDSSNEGVPAVPALGTDDNIIASPFGLLGTLVYGKPCSNCLRRYRIYLSTSCYWYPDFPTNRTHGLELNADSLGAPFLLSINWQ
jgi:hypothetical protein